MGRTLRVIAYSVGGYAIGLVFLSALAAPGVATFGPEGYKPLERSLMFVLLLGGPVLGGWFGYRHGRGTPPAGANEPRLSGVTAPSSQPEVAPRAGFTSAQVALLSVLGVIAILLAAIFFTLVGSQRQSGGDEGRASTASSPPVDRCGPTRNALDEARRDIQHYVNMVGQAQSDGKTTATLEQSLEAAFKRGQRLAADVPECVPSEDRELWATQ